MTFMFNFNKIENGEKMSIEDRLNLPQMKDFIREIVEKATLHSPLYGTKIPYLYSVLDITLPVGAMQYKTISLKRKVLVETGQDIANEEQGAIQYFLNMLMFILRAADSVEEDVYADDDETYDVVVGKSLININRNRLGMPRLYTTGSDIRIDLTKDENNEK